MVTTRSQTRKSNQSIAEPASKSVKSSVVRHSVEAHVDALLPADDGANTMLENVAIDLQENAMHENVAIDLQENTMHENDAIDLQESAIHENVAIHQQENTDHI